MKRINIYDLDGTLIDSTHRYRINEKNKIDLEYWRDNDTPEMIALDELMPLAIHALEAIANPDVYVIFATARACVEGDANYDYIEKHFAGVDKFIHRQGEDDTRGGAALKIAAIRPLLNLRQFRDVAIHVYEDNSDYLRDMCHAFREYADTVGHFSPSYQGH